MVEIHALHLRQKEEIDALFTRLGKAPPSVVAPPTASASGGRRRVTKGKGCKSGKCGSAQASPQHKGTSGSPDSPQTLSPVQLASSAHLCVLFSAQAPASGTATAGGTNTTTTSIASNQSAQSQSKSHVFAWGFIVLLEMECMRFDCMLTRLVLNRFQHKRNSRWV